MGVVYHARHVVWLDIARTDYLRQAGYSYRELEGSGVRLVVTDLKLRYRNAARYDDVVRIRCRVQDVGSRRVTFTYQLELRTPAWPSRTRRRRDLAGHRAPSDATARRRHRGVGWQCAE
jgi:acyl-CoA thioester hydrolase